MKCAGLSYIKRYVKLMQDAATHYSNDFTTSSWEGKKLNIVKRTTLVIITVLLLRDNPLTKIIY